VYNSVASVDAIAPPEELPMSSLDELKRRYEDLSQRAADLRSYL
jgi:hypothetical protein